MISNQLLGELALNVGACFICGNAPGPLERQYLANILNFQSIVTKIVVKSAIRHLTFK